MQFFAIFMLRSNIQLVECVKKIEVDRGATVQAHACRSNDAGAQHITEAASAEITGLCLRGWWHNNCYFLSLAFMPEDLEILFTTTTAMRRIFLLSNWGSGSVKKPFSSGFLWERRRGSCNHHLFTVTHVQIKTEGRKRIWDEFHLGWFFLTLPEEIFIQIRNQKSAVLVPWLENWRFFWIKFHLKMMSLLCVFKENRKANHWHQL